MGRQKGIPNRRAWEPEYDAEGGCVLVPLTQGFYARIDPESLPLIQGRVWSYSKPVKSHTGYARSGSFLMHRVVTNASPEDEVDHIDHDGLNNMRRNLRLTDHAGNMLNRRDAPFGVRGTIYFEKRKKLYRVEIKHRGKRHRFGRFKEWADADGARVRALQELGLQ